MIVFIIRYCSRRRSGRCLDPEGNGVSLSGGNGGGPSPPDGEQDKQLAAEEGAVLSGSKQEDWKKSPA